MQKIEIERVIHKASHGEVFRTVNASISETWPGVDLNSLVPVPSRTNATYYLHPKTMALVAACTKQDARTKPDKGKEASHGFAGRPHNRWLRVVVKSPPKFSYIVYAPESHVASIIEGKYAEFRNSGKMPYVTTISDFCAPKASRQESHNGREKDYIVSVNRDNARRTKYRLRESIHSPAQDGQSSFNGFVIRSTISRAVPTQPSRSHSSNGHHDLNDAAANAPKGNVHRERSFRDIGDLGLMMYAKLEQFKLSARRNRDRVNYPSGDYIVTQYNESGDGYSVSSFDSYGRRSKLTSFNGRGEILKELGPQIFNVLPRSMIPNRPPPPSKVQKRRLLAAMHQKNSIADLQPEPEKTTHSKGLRSLRADFEPRRPPPLDHWTNYLGL